MHYCQQVLFTLRVSSLLSPLHDESVYIADDEDSFQFSPEDEFTPSLQQTLKQNHRALLNGYALLKHVKTLSIQIAFKRVIA